MGRNNEFSFRIKPIFIMLFHLNTTIYSKGHQELTCTYGSGAITTGSMWALVAGTPRLCA